MGGTATNDETVMWVTSDERERERDGGGRTTKPKHYMMESNLGI